MALNSGCGFGWIVVELGVLLILTCVYNFNSCIIISVHVYSIYMYNYVNGSLKSICIHVHDYMYMYTV